MMALRAGKLLALVVLGVLPFLGLSSCASIDPIEPPPRTSFDAALVARGAQLEAIGDCNSCHTAAGGRAYAGGRRIDTPFGAIYSTNITPDPETGIGRWSERAFVRAMREGLDRQGHELYPVFPYDHFQLVADDDLHALYAFLMTRDPVHAPAHRNELALPLRFRPILAGWKLLYLRRHEFHPDPARSAEWNRGAYLVEGLGHCGACHTPRNPLGAERRDRAFAGGEAEGWDAPPLDASSPAPVPWTRDRLIGYLRHRVLPSHGIPAGPMLPVAHNLALVPEQDVDAMATYMASIAGEPNAERTRRADALLARVRRDEASGTPADGIVRASASGGEAIYAATCAVCHGGGRGPGSGQAMHLALSTAVWLPEPTNLLHIVQDGVHPHPGERGRWMPAFRGAFTEAQLAALATYVRGTFGPGGAWRDIDARVRQAANAAHGD
jgi:mono/diheme cytochrome c family protein